MLRLAGRRHWYAAAVQHTGRRSGKQYATPVVVQRVANGFVIPLPYGIQVDWLQNILASGRATISSDGKSYDVVQPEVIDEATALPLLTSWRRTALSPFHIEQYLKVTDAAPRS